MNIKLEPELKRIKDFIIENPEFIIDDVEILNTILSCIPKKSGRNVVDLRGIFADRLGEKYDLLEKTHKNVVSAAHDNIATVKSINRAVLKVLDTESLLDFLNKIDSEIKSIFNLTKICLCFESIEPLQNSWPEHKCLHIMKDGDCHSYFEIESEITPVKNVLLRKVKTEKGFLNIENTENIKSEAVIAFRISDSKDLVLLVMGSASPTYFNPDQATDLLSFFGQVIEKHLDKLINENE